ncbi:hypothetical protein Tco_0066526, partial [Tanacetum coccineum]
VRIYQKSQENNQKRASTDTRIRRVQKEAKDSKPKPEKYGYIKNHKKTVKNGQARTRELEEYKKGAKDSKPKPEKSNPQPNPSMKKHKGEVGFTLFLLTKKAQAVTSRNDRLAIFKCTQLDPTAYNSSPMIEESNGHD